MSVVDPLLLENLHTRITSLEEARADADRDWADADELFTKIEQRLSDLEARLGQLQPSYRRCRKCQRVLRSVSAKCEICGEQN